MSSFDAYTNRVELGRGGMSTVYRAVAPDGSIVALKVLAIHLAADRNALIRFQNEIRLLEELDHPNIVRLRGADLRCTPPYLVMEYIEGMSLERWVTQKGVLTPRELGPLLSDVGRALDYAHDEGIIHRDVKPSNILIRRSSGRALLTDFGIAKSADVTAFTATHARVGSIYYMSPEQIEGRLELTRASDVYSLGVTAYLALTGRHPFEGTNEISIARKHLEVQAQHVSSVNSEVPQRVGDVVMRALEKHAYRRHETAGDFVRRFRAAVAAQEEDAARAGAKPAFRSGRMAGARPVPRASRPRRSGARLRRMDGWVPFTLAVFAVVCCALGVVGLSALSSTTGRWPFAQTPLPPPILASAGNVPMNSALQPGDAGAGVDAAPVPATAARIPPLSPSIDSGTAVVVSDDYPATRLPTPTPTPTRSVLRRGPLPEPAATMPPGQADIGADFSPLPTASSALPTNLWPLPVVPTAMP